MRPALHARLRARLQNRLQNREPGLIKLPLPLPSLPLPLPSLSPLSPVVTPFVGGSNSQPSQPAPQSSSQPAPQPAPQPALAPSPASSSQQPPASAPPASNPPGQGNGNGDGGDSQSNAGGNSGNHGKGNGDSFDNGNGNSASGSSPPGSGSSSSSNPPQAQPSPSGSAPSSSPSAGTSPASASGGSLRLSNSTPAGAAATGVVALPLNNEAAAPTASSGSTPSDIVQGAAGVSSSVTKGSAPSITPGGPISPPDSSQGSTGGPSDGNGSNGSGSGSGSTGSNNPSSSSHSQLSSGAIGAIIALVIILCGLLAFYVLRKRYLRRKAERHVQWINGVAGDTPDMQETQRCTSMRSSWGTPIEHRFSDPFHMSAENSAPNTQEGVYNAESPYPYILNDRPPALPMPVYSPTENHSYSSENPFADGNVASQPARRMSSLPIRFSLISDGSGSPDPFDDSQGYVIDDHDSGVNGGSDVNRDATRGTQANFPMPPPTPSSVASVYAIGSPSQLLDPPDVLISFPDSPVSPTFGSSGTSSYPRRASVKLPFKSSQDRRDEVLLEEGDQVNVVSVYEDGWAFVQNDKNNERGLVPLDRLEMDNP